MKRPHQERYQPLFEPLAIGPVIAPNRFYQVPHCTGMGYRYPRSEAAFRGIKAEGGWGVVSTQETEIHPSSDLSPANEARLWCDKDIPALRLMTDVVHQHGSLAAIQLVHNGLHTSNRYSREIPLAPSAAVVDVADPLQARGMSLVDIKSFRRWHVEAAKRAKRAGFDIIYVYAGHDMTLLQHFLLRRHNHRNDQYGGSLSNRLRLFQEVINDTKDAVGDTCAVAVRFAVDELLGSQGIECEDEGAAIVEALANLPDLWDVNLSDWSNDSQSARFADEGYQERYTGLVKQLTNKPVVGVGRYTSPDTMLRLVRQGVFDFVGAARPSIADPFLPNKIKEGRIDDIRECIGCNICITGDNTNVPMRCTQNAAVGEEWRRQWHPEKFRPLSGGEKYLIVGGGPAGLEAARVLGERGANVTVAEALTEWGGRVTEESKLPGLATWARVKDWRLQQLHTMPNVSLHLHSALTAKDILEFSIPRVVLATGATWRVDGVGRSQRQASVELSGEQVISPSTILASGISQIPKGATVAIYDDDQFYLASALAELFIKNGFRTLFITPASVVSPWSEHTLEQFRVQKQLMSLGVELYLSRRLQRFINQQVSIACVYTSAITEVPCNYLIPVTSRRSNDQVWMALQDTKDQWEGAGIRSVQRIGDCFAPGLIATAVYSGFQLAQQAGDNLQIPLREDNQRIDEPVMQATL